MRVFFYILLFVISLNAKAILCYKEAVTTPSMMKTAILEGDECVGKTIKNMLDDGWFVKDIQTNKTNEKLNFVYIFVNNKQNIAKPIKLKTDKKIAKKLFDTRCKRCHKKSDRDLLKYKKFDDFQHRLSQYARDEISSNNAYLMSPVAKSVTQDDAKIIYNYIKDNLEN